MMRFGLWNDNDYYDGYRHNKSSPVQSHTTTVNNAFLHGSRGGIEGVSHTILLLIDLNLTGVPSWYTKVSFFRPWINCVVSAALETGGVRTEVEERCNKVAESLVPDCLDTKELMFGLLRESQPRQILEVWVRCQMWQ